MPQNLSSRRFIYVAGHTDKPGEGITCCRFNPGTGELSIGEKYAIVNRVLYLALHPVIFNKLFLFFGFQNHRTVKIRYRFILMSGRFRMINQGVFTDGDDIFVTEDFLGNFPIVHKRAV